MKSLPTQFDDNRFSVAVATPTCSSCCCCCCCLATSIATSSLLAQRIHKEGETHNVPERGLLTIVGALFLPITGLLIYGLFWTINSLLSTCTTRSYGSRYNSTSYEVCTNPASSLVLPLIVIVPILVLWFLYSRVKIAHPLARAVLISVIFGVAFSIEFTVGAMAILGTAGIGGIAYLISIPFLIGVISVWYHKHLLKEQASEIQVNLVSNQESYETSNAPKPPTASTSGE